MKFEAKIHGDRLVGRLFKSQSFREVSPEELIKRAANRAESATPLQQGCARKFFQLTNRPPRDDERVTSIR